MLAPESVLILDLGNVPDVVAWGSTTELGSLSTGETEAEGPAAAIVLGIST